MSHSGSVGDIEVYRVEPNLDLLLRTVEAVAESRAAHKVRIVAGFKGENPDSLGTMADLYESILSIYPCVDVAAKVVGRGGAGNPVKLPGNRMREAKRFGIEMVFDEGIVFDSEPRRDERGHYHCHVSRQDGHDGRIYADMRAGTDEPNNLLLSKLIEGGLISDGSAPRERQRTSMRLVHGGVPYPVHLGYQTFAQGPRTRSDRRSREQISEYPVSAKEEHVLGRDAFNLIMKPVSWHETGQRLRYWIDLASGRYRIEEIASKRNEKVERTELWMGKTEDLGYRFISAACHGRSGSTRKFWHFLEHANCPPLYGAIFLSEPLIHLSSLTNGDEGRKYREGLADAYDRDRRQYGLVRISADDLFRFSNQVAEI